MTSALLTRLAVKYRVLGFESEVYTARSLVFPQVSVDRTSELVELRESLNALRASIESVDPENRERLTKLSAAIERKIVEKLHCNI